MEASPKAIADDRLALPAILEGLYLGQLVRLLHLEGVLDSLSEPRSAEELAAPRGFDPELLRLALTFVAARTELLDRTGEGFVRPPGRGDGRRAAMLDQYLGAYAPLADRAAEVLRDPDRGPSLVDRTLHARAFARLREPSFRALPGVLRELGVESVADLGCGSGVLLTALAEENERFRGWGIDTDEAMCSAARERVEAAGVGERVKIERGDVETLGGTLARNMAESARVVVAASLLNATFARGTTVSLLSRIRRIFPDRALIVADYYGRLGQVPATGSPLCLLHDLVQALSGQGVPPPDLPGWQRLYAAAGCQPVHAFEATDGLPWFIHVVRT